MMETSNPPSQGYGGQAAHLPASNAQWGEGGASSTLKPASTIVWRILAIIIGALFIYAGAIKAWDPVGFASDIENYKILPWPIGVRLAFYLPWLEIICGVALIVQRQLYRGALLLVLILMVVFISATMAAKVRGLDITCGCFGHISDQLSFAWHLALDFALLGAVVVLFRRSAGSSPATVRHGR